MRVRARAAALTVLASVGGALVPAQAFSLPGSAALAVAAVTASADDGNVAANTVDNSLATRWSAEGNGKWIRYDLGAATTLSSLSIAWYQGNTRKALFDVQTSNDAVSWTTVIANRRSNGTTVQPESYDFADGSARYLRIVGHGNNKNAWNSITEVDIFGAAEEPPPGGLDPDSPPGTNFDLKNFKYTPPFFPDEPEVYAPDLVAGYQKANEFYTDPTTGGMVFRCPNYAGTTPGTSYSRSELREMMIPNATSGATSPANNWVLSTSSPDDIADAGGVDGTMNASLTVDHVTTTGDAAKVGRIIVGQIHGNSAEVIRLMYHKRPGDARGAVYFGHDTPGNVNTYYPIIGNADDLNPANGILLGQRWSYQIKVVGQLMTVTVTPDGQSPVTATLPLEDGYRGDKLYFKAGNYHLNNTGDQGDYAQATFYSLTRSHN
ncbi:polysaccharide lyase family 7 protein [Kribbella sp. NPDC055071]